ncbi:MAG: hypothetical protein CTY18_03065 [Methylomonas sp.]|nr:MAG: hypothetical protein CTY18_03065 [Methylomonas sp.]
MQKRDFIQHAATEFMPSLNWDVNKSIAYAERLWQALGAKGYGEPKKTGPREIANAYDKLAAAPLVKAQFDLFWAAFAHKYGRDRAAARWMLLGELTKAEYQQIINAAKVEAESRKNLPEGRVPIMAEGWLSERRWLDQQATPIDQAQKQQQQQLQAINAANQDLAHARQMAERSGDPYWQAEIIKITEKITELRRGHYAANS